MFRCYVINDLVGGGYVTEVNGKIISGNSIADASSFATTTDAVNFMKKHDLNRSVYGIVLYQLIDIDVVF